MPSNKKNEIGFSFDEIMTIAEKITPEIIVIQEYYVLEQEFFTLGQYDGEATEEFRENKVKILGQTNQLVNNYEVLIETIHEIIKQFDFEDEQNAKRINSYIANVQKKIDEYEGVINE